MDKYINELKDKRISITKKIQNDYDKLITFQEKFEFIYDLLYKNLYEYAKWNKIDSLFNNKEELLEQAKQICKKGEFINFIKEKTINVLNQGHYFMHNRPVNNNQNIIKNNVKDDNNFIYNFPLSDTLYLLFKTFFSSCLEYDKEKFSILKNEMKNKNIKNVILDIRGNVGGSDNYLVEILKCLNTSLSYKIEWFNMLFNELESYECNYNYGNSKYNFYVLIDNKVFSAGECVARAFKENGATIIGEATRGEAGMSPQLELNILNYMNSDTKKETDLMLQIPIEAPVNEKGEVDYNYNNTKPTIECDSKKALDVALSKINKLRI